MIKPNDPDPSEMDKSEPLHSLASKLKCPPCPVRASGMRNCFRCRRKYLFSSRLRLRPVYQRVAQALSLGSFYHSFRQYGPTGIAAPRKRDQKIADLAKMEVEHGDLDGRLSKDAAITVECYDKAKMMAELMWESYPEPVDMKTLLTEETISMEVKTPDCVVHVEGTLDRMVEYDTGVWIRDHKTTSFDPSFVARPYSYSDQCRLYRLLGMQKLVEDDRNPLDLKGFQLDIVRKPSIKYSPTRLDANKDGLYPSTWDAYIGRCKKWYMEHEVKPFTQLTLGWVDSSPLPTEFVQRLSFVSLMSNVVPPLSKYVLETMFTRDSNSCLDPYGRPCDYLELCTSDYSMWESIIERGFIQELEEEPEKGNQDD